MQRYRDNIIIVKLGTPKNVTLPNGRTFYSKYKRVKISLLPKHVTIKRIYNSRRGKRNWQHVTIKRIYNSRRGKRNLQQGHEFGSALRKSFSLAKKLAKSEIRKNFIKMAIKNAPNIYEKNVGKIKNKNLKKKILIWQILC